MHTRVRQDEWDEVVRNHWERVTLQELTYRDRAGQPEYRKQFHFYWMILTLCGKELEFSQVETGVRGFLNTPEEIRTWVLEFFARLSEKVHTRGGSKLEKLYLFSRIHELAAGEYTRVLHALIAEEERPLLQQAAESKPREQVR